MSYRFDTLAIRRSARRRATGAVSFPICQTIDVPPDGAGSEQRVLLRAHRSSDAARTRRESCGARRRAIQVAFASGMSAIHGTGCRYSRAGDHVVSTQDLYGGAWRISRSSSRSSESTSRFRWKLDRSSPQVEAQSVRRRDFLWLETPSTLLKISTSPHARQSRTPPARPYGRRQHVSRRLCFCFPIKLRSRASSFTPRPSDRQPQRRPRRRRDLRRRSRSATELKFFQNAIGAVPGAAGLLPHPARRENSPAAALQRHCDNAEEVVSWLREPGRHRSRVLSRTRGARRTCRGTPPDGALRRDDLVELDADIEETRAFTPAASVSGRWPESPRKREESLLSSRDDDSCIRRTGSAAQGRDRRRTPSPFGRTRRRARPDPEILEQGLAPFRSVEAKRRAYA